jgi:putative DNA primase/helicase
MARRAYVDCVKRLADVNQGGQKIGYEVEGVTGAAIRFSEEAAALFDEWTCKHMNRIRLENECEGLESHLTKYKKLVPSLALLYHVSSLGCADSTADIEPHSVEQAIKLANILESHARKVYSDEVSPEIKAAKALLSLAKEVSKEKAVWRPRDIYRRQRSGLKTAAEVEQAAKMLIEYGHLLSPEQFKELKKGQYSFNLMYHPEIEY